MTPRPLTEIEKCRQCQKLLDIGEILVLRQGIIKTSVDDIVNACGVSKGSFYKHFDSKEQYFYKLICNIYNSYINKAEKIIIDSNKDTLRSCMRKHIESILSMPEGVFFLRSENEIESMFHNLDEFDINEYHKMELDLYTRLLNLMEIDTNRVKPAVVHNYIHMIYYMSVDNLMMKDVLNETMQVMIDGLIEYVFGGAYE